MSSARVLRHATIHLGVERTATGKALGFTNARMMALAAVQIVVILLSCSYARCAIGWANM